MKKVMPVNWKPRPMDDTQIEIIKDLYDNLSPEEQEMIEKTNMKIGNEYIYKTKFPVNRMQLGNKKISSYINKPDMGLVGRVGIFSLRAIKDCVNCSSCQKTCYALQAEIQYKNARMSRQLNSFVARKHPNLLKYLIVRQVFMQDIVVIRVHESGDFYDQDYVNLWADIYQLIKYRTKLFAFTKAEYILDLSVLMESKKFNVIKSLHNGFIRNYGSEEHCDKLIKDFGFVACKDVEHDELNKVCMADCVYCLTGDKPCFKAHGCRVKYDDYQEMTDKQLVVA